MSQNKPNTKLIGVFTAIALLIGAGLIFYFGAVNLLTKSSQFVLFFDQSVNGLNVGSAVKFRGVPVGTVEQILIRAEGQREDSDAIPVIIEINQSRVANDLGVANDPFSNEAIGALLERGLVGELGLESFITGQLFVEFSFKPERKDAHLPHLTPSEASLTEIPTLTSSLDQITADAAQFISDIADLDLDELLDNVNGLLSAGTDTLAAIDSEGMSLSISELAQSITEFVQTGEINETLAEVRSLMATMEATVQSFNLNDGPLTARIDSVSESVKSTLSRFDRLTSSVERTFSPDSNLRFEVESMVRELNRAARSIRLLSEYLERNPNSIITGRR